MKRRDGICRLSLVLTAAMGSIFAGSGYAEEATEAPAEEKVAEVVEMAPEETALQAAEKPVAQGAEKSVETAAVAAAQPKATPRRQARHRAGVIQLDETVISGNQELPKVLYILPWQQPHGLPDIQVKTEFTELEVFRRLYPPAYRRELSYFATLNGSDSEE